MKRRSPTAPTLSALQVRKLLPRRPADAYKGQNGHALVLAGSRGMSGAAELTARGALRIGAGLLTSAIVESERSAVTRLLPESLTLSLPETSAGVIDDTAIAVLQGYFRKRKINALAIGPGLSVSPTVAHVIRKLLKDGQQPVVVDADGLNNLSLQDFGERSDVIITPHAGELSRLMKIDIDTLQRERERIAERMAKDYNVICVLKGRHTVISDGKTTRVNPTGNQAMATGGMGDVLTGAIVGLLAQGLKPLDAAIAGVYLHGLAGDLARISDRGLLASDVAEALPRALSKVGVK